MEFLQRHLPRVYQAVQDALNFFTNVTAQIFGAPPDAPRPRDARTNVPIPNLNESGGPTAQEGTCDKKETSLATSTPELSRTIEENGDSGRGHPGDEVQGTRETDLKHGKSDPGGRGDLEHKITEDLVLHTTAEITTESFEIEVKESTESKNNQEQVNPPNQQELKKEYQRLSVACEIKVSQYVELLPRAANLSDDEPLRNSEHKAYKDEEHTGTSSSDSQHDESFFQQATLYSLSFKEEKPTVSIIGPEKSEEEEGKIKCVIEITRESEEYNIDLEQEAQELVESVDSTVTVEYEFDTILDVVDINKKLVTPADDTECSPYSQKKDRRGTLEDLLETANRLAKHCDAAQTIEVQKGSETLPDFGETPDSVQVFISPKGQEYTEEDLISADAIEAQNTFPIEVSESKQTGLDEETMKAQSLVLEQSRSSGESNNSIVQEGKDISTKDGNVSRENEENVQGIEEHATEKLKENHQFKEFEPNISESQRTKRRVHFSPSTEDLFIKKSERASRDTLQRVYDDILEGGLQPGREDSEKLESSYIIKDFALSPDKDEERDYVGGSFFGHEDGQPTGEEEQLDVITESRAVWYDDYQARAECNERCESLANQNEHVDFKIEESFELLTESGSTQENLDDIPSIEDMLSVVTEHVENINTSESNNFKIEKIERPMENKNELHPFQEIVNNSEKESVTVPDRAKETAGKEDSLQETQDQLLEVQTDLLEYDTTYADESVDYISQSTNTLDTMENGLQKDFMDELKQTDNLDLEQAISDQTNPAEDIDHTQLEIIHLYSAHKDIIETGSTAEYEAPKEFTLNQEDLLKSLEEQTESCTVQLEEDTALQQPVSKNSDDEFGETQLSTLVNEICVSVLEDDVLRDGLPSEEHKDAFRDANVQGECEPLNEISNHEMEEQQNYMNEKQNYGYKHEGFPPETSEAQEEDRKVKTEPLSEEQYVAEEQHVAGTEASLNEGLGNKQMQDGSEESPEESYETGQSASINEPFHSTLDVSAQKSRVLLLRKTSVRRRPGQRPVTFTEGLAEPSPPTVPPINMGVPVFPDQMPAFSPPVPPSFESSYSAKEPTEAGNTSETILRRKSSIRRRGQRPVTFQEELAESLMPGITSAKSTHPTEEPKDEGTTSEQILHRKSSIRRHQGQRPVEFEDEPVGPSLPPSKMGVPNFLGGMPMASASESSHLTEEPTDEGATLEPMLRRKSSVRRPKVKQPETSEDHLVEPPQPLTAPRMGVPLFPAVPVTPSLVSTHPTEEPTDEGATSEPMLRRKSSVRRPKVKQPETSEDHLVEPPQPLTAPKMGVPLFPAIPVTPSPVSSHPTEELKEEKTESEGRAIKPKKGFMKHAGFGGAHPGMMQELQARLHRKKPKE